MALWPTIVDDLTRLNKALFDAIKAYIDDLISVQGVPPGGATNDILQKASATNYDDAWTDAPILDSVTLDTTAAEATGIAKLHWDAQDVTAAIGLNSTITYHLGAQELVRVSNRTGSAISAGKAVYIIGAHGDRPEVALADASSEATAATTLGITAESIADSGQGYVCVSGLLRNLYTDNLTEGALVWLSETAGDLTSTRPTQPAHGVFLGLCVKKGPGTSGILYVSVVNGQELEELHDVLISSPAAYDILQRNAANTLWVNTPASSISIGTAADLGGGTAGQIPYQASPGDTQFFGPGTAGDILKSNGTSAPSYSAPAALTKTDDTNVTLTLGGSASTALVNAASITAGWTGTLAASRLNSNVVQAVTNDTNVTGSIATQNLTLGWTGQLSIARGGTGASTAQAAINALAGAVTSGQYLRGNGTNVVMSAIQVADVPTLNQNTTGSAATLTTARTLTIGNTGKTFNGSANVSWTIAEIGALALTGGTLTGSVTSATGMTAWNTTTPGTTVGNIQIGTASSTANSGGAITFAARDGGGGSNAQAGIYIISDGSYGTKMYLATTDSYVTGSKTAVSIDQAGVVNFARARPTYLGNTIIDTANYSSYALPLTGGTLTGDITTYRAGSPTTGVIYLGNSGTRYLYYDGTNYNLNAANLNVNSLRAGTWTGSASYRGIYHSGMTGSEYIIMSGDTDTNTYISARTGSSVHIRGGNNVSTYAIVVSPTARATSAGNTILDAGNYSSYALPLAGNATMTGSWSSTATIFAYGNGNTGTSAGISQLNVYSPAGGSGAIMAFHRANAFAVNMGLDSDNVFRIGGWSAAANRFQLDGSGNLTVPGTKSFEIDHPVDATKKLRYGAIEAPRVDVIHRGTTAITTHRTEVDLDAVARLLPGTFAALVRDAQCFLVSNDSWMRVRGTVQQGTLTLITEQPVDTPFTVDWLVIGERQDEEIRSSLVTDADGRLINEYPSDNPPWLTATVQ